MPSIAVTNSEKVTTLDIGSSSPQIGGTINLDKFTTLQEFHGESNALVGLAGTENITTLLKLHAFRNIISGALPSFAANTLIQEILLHINSYTGSIILPASGNSLQRLEIYRNQLSGTIPSLPTSLTTLLLNENALTGSIPTLNTSTGLLKINLSQNSISGQLPALPSSVQEFNVSQNQILGELPILPESVRKVKAFKNNLGATGGSFHDKSLQSLGDKKTNDTTGLAEFEINSQSVSFGVSQNNTSGNDRWGGPRTVETVTATVDDAVTSGNTIVFDAISGGTIRKGMIAKSVQAAGEEYTTNGISGIRRVQSVTADSPAAGHTTVVLDGDISNTLPNNSKVIFTFSVPVTLRIFKAHENDLLKADKRKILAAFYTAYNDGTSQYTSNQAKTIAINGSTYNGTSSPTPNMTVYNNTGTSVGIVTATADTVTSGVVAGTTSPYVGTVIRLNNSTHSADGGTAGAAGRKIEVGMHVTGSGVPSDTYVAKVENNQKKITVTQTIGSPGVAAGAVCTFTNVLHRFHGDNTTVADAKTYMGTVGFTLQGF